MSEQPPRDRLTKLRLNAKSRWRCGFEQMGMACAEGPSESGECCQVRARKECEAEGAANCQLSCAGAASCEIAKMRPRSLRLTNDALGPCIPVKAAWFSRQTLALNVAILVGGILLCAMAIPQREAIFVPGSLSAKHSQILGNRLVSERCSQCHPNSHSGIDSAFAQDDLCMKCHESHLPDALLRSPHDLTTAQFMTLASDASKETLVASSQVASSQVASSQAASELQLPRTRCAQCHLEHHGASHNLNAISDQRCQACHETKFSSFNNGHPEFRDFPYRTQRRIAFDHRSHADKHFTQKSEVFECNQCHQSNSPASDIGAVSRSVGFEEACARCHSESIRSSTIEGWAVLQLPSIDAQDATDPAFGLMTWPQAARYGYDGPVTTPMRLLLAADPDVAETLAYLPKTGQLADIAIHKSREVEAVQKLAAGMKRLIADVAEQGQAAWKTRLIRVAKQGLDRELSPTELVLIDEMVAGLPPDLFRQIEQDWFGSASPSLVEDSHPIETDTKLPAQLVSGQDLLDESDLLGEDFDAVDADALLLGEADASDLLMPSEADELLNSGGHSSAATSKATKLTKIRGSKHVPQGGWYLDAELLAVRYMPKGHADPLLAAWTQFEHLLETRRKDKAQQLYNSRTARSGWHAPEADVVSSLPGGCTDCHLLPATAGKKAWASVIRPAGLRLFTKFDHNPHLALPMVRDCQYCHVLNAEADAIPGAIQVSSMHSARSTRDYLLSEFKSMQQSQCNACHRSGAASNACTQCHNYHVGSEGFDWSNAH